MSRDWIMGAIALTFVGGLIALIAALLFYTIPEGAKETLNIVIGVLAGGVATILNYYFGSSASSRDKDSTISTMAGNQPPPPNP
jgi:hypothetical protein